MKALVTGGTRGIGAAIVQRLRADGHEVFTFSRTGGDIRADVLNPADVEAVKVACGPVQILINNVGGGGRWGPAQAEQAEMRVWDEVYRKNATVAADFTGWALPGMMAHRWGRVVTIGSIHGLEAGGKPWFAAAKAAQVAMMGTFARDLRFVRRGITFNTIAPGNVFVEGKPVLPMESSPLGRMVLPSEVASMVGYLCSREASAVNGSCMTVDGGESNRF